MPLVLTEHDVRQVLPMDDLIAAMRIVDSRAGALAEAGDIVLAIEEGAITRRESWGHCWRGRSMAGQTPAR